MPDSSPPPSVDRPVDSEPTTVRVGEGALPQFGEAEDGITAVTSRVSTDVTEVRLDQAFVTVLHGPEPGRIVELPEGSTGMVIGRSSKADMTLEEPSLSRRHVRVLRWLGISYMAEDLRSSNGTYVNGARIERRTPLNDGDRLQLGPRVILRFTIGDRQEAELQRNLYEGATRDALTQLYNRGYVLEQLEGEVAFSTRHDTRLCVVLLDIDHFKQVNDRHGHPVGDAVLSEVARRLAGSCRTEDTVARYGGEEFMIVLREVDLEAATVVAERARQAIASEPVAVDGRGEVPVTISLGIASLEELGVAPSVEGLINLADRRLYRAKEAGRNRSCTE